MPSKLDAFLSASSDISADEADSSLSAEDYAALTKKAEELRRLVEEEGVTLDKDQLHTMVAWYRASLDTQFSLVAAAVKKKPQKKAASPRVSAKAKKIEEARKLLDNF